MTRELHMKGRILLVEDDATFRGFLRTVLEDDGHDVQTAEDGAKGLQLLRRESFDLVISDLKMPGKSGLELFHETRSDPASPQFIFLTAFGRVEEAVAAMKEGALDFLTKPLADPDALLLLVGRAIENQCRTREYLSLKETEAAGLPPEELIFAGQAMKEVRKLVRNVAVTTANVLIYGESGTGKELVARTIHLLSPRRAAGFVPLNCAAIPETSWRASCSATRRGLSPVRSRRARGNSNWPGGGRSFSTRSARCRSRSRRSSSGSCRNGSSREWGGHGRSRPTSG